MKLIVVSVFSKMHVNLYLRMRKALAEKGYEFLFLTSQYTTYKYISNKGCKAELIKYRAIKKERKEYRDLREKLSHSMDVVLNVLSIDKAVGYYKTVYEMLDNINREQHISVVFAFQNVKIDEMALHDFAQNHHINRLFFEFSNIPGKLFCDREGSNKKSELFISGGHILDRFECPTDEEYKMWKDQYLKIKFAQISVPQARIIPRTNREKLIDLIFSFFITHLPFSPINPKTAFKININRLFVKLFNKHPLSKNLVDFDFIANEKKYLFFPLQVSSDTQIVINSKISLIEALEKAVEIAKRTEKLLVIKPHPAEYNKFAQEKIISIAQKYGCIICNNNTFDLISHSYKVITINSTVGLESMILGVPVIVLADTFYKNFTYEQLKKYLLRYLINIELFSNKIINNVDEILERSKCDSIQ